MPGKTAAPWEVPYSEPLDEPKTWPTLQKEQSERIAALFKEKTLSIKSYSGPATLAAGELAAQNKGGETFTLPAATTANRVIGVVNLATTAIKVTTSGGAGIYGGPAQLTPIATIQLEQYQYVELQSDGGNWLIVGGEPRPEQKYQSKVYSHTEFTAGVTLSTTHPVLATIGPLTTGSLAIVTVAGEEAGSLTTTAGCTVWVGPGQVLAAAVGTSSIGVRFVEL